MYKMYHAHQISVSGIKCTSRIRLVYRAHHQINESTLILIVSVLRDFVIVNFQGIDYNVALKVCDRILNQHNGSHFSNEITK